MKEIRPLRTGDLLRQAPGKWVAIKDDEIVLAADTAYALVMDLHDKGITGVTIARCPDLDEPLRVGLG